MDEIVLINAAEAATSKTTVVAQKKQITIAVSGTATSATVQFKGRVGDTEILIFGIRTDFETGAAASMNEVWRYDLSGFTHFTAEVTAVSGGNVSVKGRW